MFNHILIAVDASSCSRQAARFGLQLAQRLGSQVAICHVQSNSSESESDSNLLEPWVVQGQSMGLYIHAWPLKGDKVWDAIVGFVKKQQLDLIVMGTHGREGLQHLMLGSVAERVSRLSPVPVLLVRGGATEAPFGFERLLTLVDGSQEGRPAFAFADALAQEVEATLQALFVVPPYPNSMAESWGEAAIVYDFEALEKAGKEEGRRILEAARQQIKAKRVEVYLEEAVFSPEADVIVDFAEEH